MVESAALIKLLVLSTVLLVLCESFTDLTDVRSQLKTTTIRIVTHNLPPVVFVKWNETTGYPSEISGFAPAFLELISKRFEFSYSWVPIGRDVFTDSTPTLKGFVDYVLDGEADLILTGSLPIAERFKKIGYTMPVLEGPFSIMIPFPANTVDKNALAKPFQFEVWICTLVSLVLVAGVWHFIQRTVRIVLKLMPLKKTNEEIGACFPIIYVVSVLLSQGNHCESKWQAIRITAGTWCLATLVLVPAYSGNLLSFIVSPTVKPIVNSIYDIPNVPGLRAAVDRNLAAETFLKQAKTVDSMLLRSTVEIIEKTIYRCNTSSACVERVLEGTHVYIHGRPVIDELMLNDFKKTQQCRFAVAKEPVGKGILCFATAKQSPYTSFINRGILELDAFGLSNYWREKFAKKATKCSNPRAFSNLKQTRLSWATLSATFILLGAGYGFAFVAFFLEKLSRYFIKEK